MSDAPTLIRPPGTYEVGFAHHGCPDDVPVAEKRAALQTLIDDCGDEADGWYVVPEIREYHNHGATVGLLDFGRRIDVNDSVCQWAVYGVRFEQPHARPHYVPEGTRLPVHEKKLEAP